MRRLIKVVATHDLDGPHRSSSVARGIATMPRGRSSVQYAADFLAARGITTFSIMEREYGWATAPIWLRTDPVEAMTFTFMPFDEDELGYHAKDLTKAELERDMKKLGMVRHG